MSWARRAMRFFRACSQPKQCSAIAGLYPAKELFRSRVVMGRHGFGRGEYQYFKYPLPDAGQRRCRASLYPHLAAIANRWNDWYAATCDFPSEARGVHRCGVMQRQGQLRPTPLLLQYQADDYNCLHQDLYMESMSFRCKLPCCCRSRARISPAVSSS